jgi:hypothetical protein
MSYFIYYQAYSGALLLSILVLGSLITHDNHSNGNSISSLYARKLFWGTLLTITSIALFFTRGNTVLLGFLIPVFFILINLKKQIRLNNPFKEFSFKTFLLIAFSLWSLSIIFSFLEFIKYYNSELGLITEVPHFDFLYYGKLSKYMVEYGAENRLFFLNQLIENATEVRQPYHYPELWVNGVLVKTSGTSSVGLLLFSTFPILKAITCSSIFLLALGNKKPSFRFQPALIAISILTISGFYFPFYNNSELLKYFDGITQAGFFMTFGKKYVLIYLVAGISIFYYYQKEKYLEFLLILSIIPFISIGSLPSICSIEVLFPIYLIYTKKISWKNLIPIYANQVLIICFIILYYSLNGLNELNDTLSDSTLVSRLIHNPNIELLKTFFFSFFFTGVRFVLFVLPYCAILIFLRYNNLKHLLNSGILGAVSMLGGLIAVGLSVGILDNGQFFYNSIPILFLILAFEINKSLQELPVNSNNKIITPIILLLFGIWHFRTDFEYEKESNAPYNQISTSLKVKNLKNITEHNDGSIIGLFKAKGLDKTKYTFLDSYYLNSHFYLQLSPNYKDAINIDISDFIIPGRKLNSVDQYLIKQNELFYYLKNSNQELTGASLTSFSRKIKASFFADGDSLYIINKITDKELEKLFNKHVRQ